MTGEGAAIALKSANGWTFAFKDVKPLGPSGFSVSVT